MIGPQAAEKPSSVRLHWLRETLLDVGDGTSCEFVVTGLVSFPPSWLAV